MRELTEHEAKVVKEFTMEPTNPGGGKAGKGVRFTLRVLAYADGKVFLRDDHKGAGDPEPYPPDGQPDVLFTALCERAIRLAGGQDEDALVAVHQKGQEQQ